jgi:hypothetical protein
MNYLASIEASLGSNPTLKVGFLSGSTYPDGTSVAMVAAVNEWGGTIHRDAGQTTIYRKINASGGFLRKGRFVKQSQSNFATTHAVGAYTIIIPPRPFFRTMIKENAGSWGPDFAKLIKDRGYESETAMAIMGERIQGQLQQSIIQLTDPPNAPSTIAKKGFDKPLIDKGVMLRSVGYEVSGQLITSTATAVSTTRAPGSFGGIAARFGKWEPRQI